MRRLIAFPCASETLAGTLDEAKGPTGVLIVSGGNETRTGAHRGMAMLAQRLAARGIPVFRFDRRGVGDSSGESGGYADSAPDIAAAAAVFRAEAGVNRIVGLGNCDGATALALFGRRAGVDALALTNPWLGDGNALPPPAAVRARYFARLRDPASWWRGFNISKLLKGLRSLAQMRAEPPLAARMAAALSGSEPLIVLAEHDRTALQFAAAWTGPGRLLRLPTASHSFADATDALEAAIVEAVHSAA